MEFVEKKIFFDNLDLVTLFGFNDNFLSLIENRFDANLFLRGNALTIKGTQLEVEKIEQIIAEMSYILKRNKHLSEHDVKTVIDLVDVDKKQISDTIKNATATPIIYTGYRDTIRAKNPKQIEYLNKVNANDLVFAIGPAGTGKTYLAVAMALAALKNNEVSRIIITRPAVEAGESLGFLPGDLREKIDPYLRPITDAFQQMISPEKLKSMNERQIIEITPLAYMRGRTLNDSFIILDEAQNSTTMQMKMFLTRLGAKSKAIITGDITQIDLDKGKKSGLIHAQHILKNISGIEFVYFTNNEVIRHRLVADIIRAYEKEEAHITQKKITNPD